MRTVDERLYRELSRKASESPRRRAHHLLHASREDAVQRLAVVMHRATYIRPHRHALPQSDYPLAIRAYFGDEGLARLADLLRAYLHLGGLQVQLSFADLETLRDSQRHPERHRDLMVRITGYSAAFVDMTRAAQDEIIRRTGFSDT